MHLIVDVGDVRQHAPSMPEADAKWFLHSNQELFRDAVWELLQDLIPARLADWKPFEPPTWGVRKILVRHPGQTTYHDNTFWVRLPGMQKGAGIWLKPGQAIALVDFQLPVDKPPPEHSGFFDSPNPCAGDTLGDAY